MQKIGFNQRYGLQQAVFVRAKTMTRRLEKPLDNAVKYYRNSYSDRPAFNIISQRYSERGGIEIQLERDFIFIPTRYKLNEIVAVAQPYRECVDKILNNFGHKTDIATLVFKKMAGWNNKMFVRADLMPNQIQITGIRIEQLQDISDEDCLNEGVFPSAVKYDTYHVWGIRDGYLFLVDFRTPRDAFAALIERPGVGRKGLWAENPHVVAYTFKLIK